MSESFIVSKLLGILEAGWDAHIVCQKSESTEWQQFPQLQQYPHIRDRIHITAPVTPRWKLVLYTARSPLDATNLRLPNTVLPGKLTMTPHEHIRILLQPFLPALYSKVHQDLSQLVSEQQNFLPQILDVGGRKSPYTIGLPAQITVLDVPRQTEVQEDLHLGLTASMLDELRRSRSNIVNIVLQDMTQCTLPSNSFDGVIAVEVIEHVQEANLFIQHIARILKAGGWLYLTTPNGDYIKNEPPNYNPDHIRHYTRNELYTLLSDHFEHVEVYYGIKTGKHRYKGLRPITWHHPLRTVETMFNNLINHFESRNLAEQTRRTAHLLALAR